MGQLDGDGGGPGVLGHGVRGRGKLGGERIVVDDGKSGGRRATQCGPAGITQTQCHRFIGFVFGVIGDGYRKRLFGFVGGERQCSPENG